MIRSIVGCRYRNEEVCNCRIAEVKPLVLAVLSSPYFHLGTVDVFLSPSLFHPSTTEKTMSLVSRREHTVSKIKAPEASPHHATRGVSISGDFAHVRLALR